MLNKTVTTSSYAVVTRKDESSRDVDPKGHSKLGRKAWPLCKTD